MNTLLLAAGSVTLFAAASAHADFIDVKFLGTGSGQSVRIDLNGHAQNVFAGQLRHQLSNGTGAAAAMNGTHITFCSDLLQHVSQAGTTYQVVTLDNIPAGSPMGLAKASALYDIYNFAAGAELASGAANRYAAAFQLAVWEIVNDFDGTAGSLSLTGGHFKAFNTDGSAINSTINSNVAGLFAAVTAPHAMGNTLVGLSSGSNQDQVLSGFTVPTPGSMTLAGLGGLLAARRRRTN